MLLMGCYWPLVGEQTNYLIIFFMTNQTQTLQTENVIMLFIPYRWFSSCRCLWETNRKKEDIKNTVCTLLHCGGFNWWRGIGAWAFKYLLCNSKVGVSRQHSSLWLHIQLHTWFSSDGTLWLAVICPQTMHNGNDHLAAYKHQSASQQYEQYSLANMFTLIKIPDVSWYSA